jgi:bifunctional UDP-N-acetylglucosamine pyrophosphorylase/glucosamine-1-phosphate N-acetyltransferase
MKALIFAAGRGKRMMPLTADRPKPLLEISGRPILEYTLEALPDAVTEIILVVGYRGEMIKDRFGASWQGRSIIYIEQKEPRGTWHALEICKPHIKPGERFLVLYSDDLYAKEDIEKLLAYPLAALVFEVEDPRRFGVYVVDEERRIIDSEEGPEHPKSNLANMGVYVLNGDIFDYAPDLSGRGEYLLTEGLQKFIRDHAMYAHTASFWTPIAFPEDIKKAEEALERHVR